MRSMGSRITPRTPTDSNLRPMDPWTRSTIPLRAQAVGGQPGRDCRPDHAGGPGGRSHHGCCLFRLRPPGPARAHGRRGLAARRQPSGRHLPAHRQAGRDRASLAGRCGAPRLRVPCGERRVRRRVPRRRADFRRPDAGRDQADGQQDRCAPGRHRRRRARGPRHRPAGAGRCARRRRPAKCRRDRLPGDAQGSRRRRRKGHAAGPRRRVARRAHCGRRGPRRSRPSAAPTCTSSGGSTRLGTSRSSCSAIGTAPSSRSSSGSVPCSAATRKWSRRAPRRPSVRSFVGRWLLPRSAWRNRSATPTRGPSSSCSMPMAGSTSSR